MKKCRTCKTEDGVCMRYSLGLPTSYYCDECWDKSGYRKEGCEGYDYLHAGEYYDEDY